MPARSLKTTLTALLFCSIAAAGSVAHAQSDSTVFSSPVETDAKPWTHLDFANDPSEFQFAIISDRTGGHREGVFPLAIKKLNVLKPEFVMSVGDLIEGYIEDEAEIDRQWSELQALIEPLEVPFFFLPGNHDTSNEVMRREWRQRYGVAFYSFMYKEALFIALDSNEEGDEGLSEQQVARVKETLAQHPDARWTFVFMHHPLWTYPSSGFEAIETALEGRPYSVIAGHRHRYLHDVKHGEDYFVLGTTGGGSELRGPKFGEFDHVTWVTLTHDQGPLFMNMKLDGLVDPDVSNPQTRALARSLQGSADFAPQVLFSPDRERATVTLLYTNDGDRPLHVEAQFFHHHQARASLREFERTVAPHSAQRVQVEVEGLSAPLSNDMPPLEMQWSMSYDTDDQHDFALRGVRQLPFEPQTTVTAVPERDTFVDELRVQLETPFPNAELRYTTDGSRPTQEDKRYGAPFTIDQTTAVNVRVFGENGYRGAVNTFTFTKASLREPAPPASSQPGLDYAYYEGEWEALPDFGALEPAKTGVATNFDVSALADRKDSFAIRYDGYVEVPVDGLYTFYLRSDDGSKLYVGGTLVVDNDGSHSAETKEGYVALAKGKHPIQVQYFEDFSGQVLEVGYEGLGLERQAVPFRRYSHAPSQTEDRR